MNPSLKCPVRPSPLPRPRWSASSVLLPVLLLGACGGGSDAAETAAAGDDVTLGAAPSTEVAAIPVAAASPADAPATAAAPAPAAATPAPAPAPAPSASTSDGYCGIAGFQADLLNRINAARATARSCGSTAYAATGTLAWNGALFNAAEGHSRDMAVNSYFAHTGLDGRSVAQRVSAAGYSWRSVGENIAGGPTSAAAVMSGWLSSPGHCANIMNNQYQDVAVACVQRSGSPYGRYWTMVLARPS
jgi:uncharacterized protein YkwD